MFSSLPQDMPHGDNFDLDCELCHATESWEVNLSTVKFDHTHTGFPLLGGHKRTEFRNCHQDLRFSFISTSCADCHTDIHKSELGFRCDNCHTPVSWENRREMFEQHIETNFPLVGVHAILDCQSCHIDEQNREYANTPVECSGCHLKDYDQTTNPDHSIAGFDTKCENCHLPNAIPGIKLFIHIHICSNSPVVIRGWNALIVTQKYSVVSLQIVIFAIKSIMITAMIRII